MENIYIYICILKSQCMNGTIDSFSSPSKSQSKKKKNYNESLKLFMASNCFLTVKYVTATW